MRATFHALPYSRDGDRRVARGFDAYLVFAAIVALGLLGLGLASLSTLAALDPLALSLTQE